jgi:hypothetical protein
MPLYASGLCPGGQVLTQKPQLDCRNLLYSTERKARGKSNRSR